MTTRMTAAPPGPMDETPALDQLALPSGVATRLREIAAFARTKAARSSVRVLFAGSGSGKRAAAQALAGAFRLDLFRIDLGAVVSKYIGETEKNLDRLFREAEQAGAVLLLDEAEALFGKRSEVKDSHDRYANVDVAFLLQRLEDHRGLAILTTNRKQDLDPAFLRRLRFVVEFPPRRRAE